MYHSLPIILLFFIQNITLGQEFSDTIFFKTGSYQLLPSELAKISKIPDATITLTGRADFHGDFHYNKILSKERIAAVHQQLLKNGHSDSLVYINNYGETHPIGNNKTETDLANNRSVIIKYSIIQHKIVELPKILPDEYNFKNSNGVTIELENGTKITIQPNTFQVPSNAPIELKITSYSSKSDFILANLHSMAGDQLLESAGMFHIEASSKGQSLTIRPDKDITFQIPNTRQKPDFDVFYAKGGTGDGSGDEIDWQFHAERPRGKFFSIPNGQFTINDSETTHPILYIHNKRTVVPSRFFPKHVKSQWFKIDRSYFASSFRPQRTPITLKVYITVDSLKVVSYDSEVLTGTLSQTCKRRVEKAIKKIHWKRKKSSYDLVFNFKYRCDEKQEPILSESELLTTDLEKVSVDVITMSVTELGWINCDRFYKAKNKKPLYVLTDPNASVKVIFTKFNGIINGEFINRKGFSFGEIPINEPYQILAYKKVVDGILVAEQTNGSNEKLNYELVSTEEFMTLLKKY